tara:strand:+ start:9348 stop:9548 length:201 start_codon:yes stop_codon:yes gene_type:complete
VKHEDDYRNDLLEIMLFNWKYMENHEPYDWTYEEVLAELKGLIENDMKGLAKLKEAIRHFYWGPEE